MYFKSISLIALFICLAVANTAQAAKNKAISTNKKVVTKTLEQVKFDPSEGIQKIEDYLNSIHTLTSAFTQIDKNQNIRNGNLILSKPNQMRFNYLQNPQESIILDGDFLLYYSKELGEKNYISSASFPVDFLSKKNINITKDAEVLKIEEDKNHISISLMITDMDSYKVQVIGLQFNKNPMILASLTLQDEQGDNTTMEFTDIEVNVKLGKRVFEID